MNEDLGWTVDDQWGRARYSWTPFNASYGTWYRLGCERKGLRSDVKVASGKVATVLVQPDMEPGRWYWSIRVGATQKTREKPKWGHEGTAEESMAAARDALMSWGREPYVNPENVAWT